MKKILILCSSLLLCGCSANQIFGQAKPDYDSSYQIKAEISFGELEASADVTRNSKDNWEFCFTEPGYLAGMKLILADDELTASLGNISITTEANDYYDLIPDIIAESIDSLPDIQSENIIENEDVLTLNTVADGKKVIVTSDKSGNLISLRCPYYKFSVDFSGQEHITSAETDDNDDMGGVEIISE